VITWGTIVYGAGLSAVLATGALLLGLRERRLSVVVPGAIATLASPIGWNAILRATHAQAFFTDAPIAVFPVSWQDAGSGVFTFAGAALVLGVLRRRDQAGEVLAVVTVVALVAFLVDIYLY
jgi:hypothetical protein